MEHDLARLSTLRDELRVQLELAKAEIKQEWDRLETTWLQIQDEIKRTADSTKEPLHTVSAGTKQLIDELKHGYDRIRSQIKASH